MDCAKFKLKEISYHITDGEHCSVQNSEDGGFYLLSNKNIIDGNIVFGEDERKISKETFDKINKRTKLSKGDLVISTVGTLGKLSIIKEIPNYDFQRSVGIIKPNCSVVDVEYLYYYMQQSHVQKKLTCGSSGAIQKCIFINQLKDFEVQLPSLSIQHRLASALSSFDKRIENLRAQNRVLEQTAKTIYDYTFLQCTGHQTTYNKTLNRNIPVGWEVKRLGDLVSVSKESLNPQNYPEKQFKHFSIPSFDDNGSYSLEYGKDIFSNKFIVNNNHVLISKLNPWKNRAVWCDENDDAIGSTEFVTLLPRKLENKAFVFSIVKSGSFIEYCSDAATGTSHSHRRVSPDIMVKFPIAYDEKTVAKFNAQVTPLFKKQLINIKQIKALTTQRNTLLPLLMTGQVGVK